jgi:hypothetical protein
MLKAAILNIFFSREKRSQSGCVTLSKYTVKKVSDFPVPRQDDTNQTLPDREYTVDKNYSQP